MREGSLHALRPFSVRARTRHHRTSRLVRGAAGQGAKNGAALSTEPEETVSVGAKASEAATSIS